MKIKYIKIFTLTNIYNNILIKMFLLTSNIYKSRKIILEQLQTRGFDISNFDNFSIHEVSIMIEQDQLDMLVENENNEKVYIKYNLQKKLNTQTIYNIVEELYETEETLNKETDQIIFIINNEPNDNMKNDIIQLWNTEKIFCSIYNIARLQYNILTHELVPKHKIMNEAEIENMKNKYNILDIHNQLPQISRFDPVSLAIGLRPGQVCHITRKSPTSIYSDFYRICV